MYLFILLILSTISQEEKFIIRCYRSKRYFSFTQRLNIKFKSRKQATKMLLIDTEKKNNKLFATAGGNKTYYLEVNRKTKKVRMADYNPTVNGIVKFVFFITGTNVFQLKFRNKCLQYNCCNNGLIINKCDKTHQNPNQLFEFISLNSGSAVPQRKRTFKCKNKPRKHKKGKGCGNRKKHKKKKPCKCACKKNKSQ